MGSESRVCFRAHTVKTCVFMAFGSGTQNKRFLRHTRCEGLEALASTRFSVPMLNTRHSVRCAKKCPYRRETARARSSLRCGRLLLFCLGQHRTIAEASAVESPIRQETIGFPAHFFARAHNFKPPGRACQPEADSPMRT